MANPRKSRTAARNARARHDRTARRRQRIRRDKAYRRARNSVKTTHRAYRTGKRNKSERRVVRGWKR